MADDSASAPSSALSGADPLSDSTAAPPKSPRGVQVSTIPTWQHLEWSRNPPEGIYAQPAAPPAAVADSAPVVPPLSSDSEDEGFSDSDEDYPDPLATKQVRTKAKKSRFPVRTDLNDRISLWLGDPTELGVDALVNPTPITSTDRKGLGGRILEAGGKELETQLRSLERARTGEVRPTPGFKLATSTILHTVGPRYSPQYITAAENALHSCYRSAIDYCVENKLKTLAIPPVHSLHRHYPTVDGSHIAIRTIRRLLEYRPAALDRIVLVFDTSDAENVDVYYSLMRLYFPRNMEEQTFAMDKLPTDTGNEFGETVVEERKVRINAAFMPGRIGGFSSPASATASSSRRFVDDEDEEDEEEDEEEEEEAQSAPRRQAASLPAASSGASATASSSAHDDSSFAPHRDASSFPASMRSMTSYKDSERRRATKGGQSSKAASGALAFEETYAYYLALANKTDLSRVSGLGLFYNAGNDHMGRPVIAIIGCRLPADPTLHDIVFLHYIKFMDTYAEAPYIILYVHTNVSSKKKPEVAWFRKVYSVMDAKYGQSLVALHVLHPTFWLKVVEKLVSVFMSSTYVLDKISYHERLVDLSNTLRFLPRLPNDILEADAAENGPLPKTLTGPGAL